jgi:hypothetical protein
VNAEAAHNYGVEIEVRKSLAMLGDWLLPFTVFGNTTLMRSLITPGADTLSALTNANRPMVGQAEYVVNAGLTYSNFTGSVNATVLYNVVGPRITEATQRPLAVDTYEQARHPDSLRLRRSPVSPSSSRQNPGCRAPGHPGRCGAAAVHHRPDVLARVLLGDRPVTGA